MALSTIGTAAIADDAVTTAKVAADAITATEIDDDGTGFTFGDINVAGAVVGSGFAPPFDFFELDGTDGSSTDAGDNLLLDASASGTDVGEKFQYEPFDASQLIESFRDSNTGQFNLKPGNGSSGATPSFRVICSASSTITNNSGTTIALDQGVVDTHNFLLKSDNSINFDETNAGVYFVTGQSRLLYSPTRFRIFFQINGGNLRTGDETTNANAGSGSYQGINCSGIHRFGPGDKLLLRIYFLATGNQPLYAGAGETEISGFRISL